MPRPFPDILSGKGREVFLGTFLYYRIECILELLGKPFHMFLGALNTTSLFLNVRRMIQYMHYQNKQQEANSHPKTNQASEQDCTCNIKGNKNSKGEKIYHMPGQQFYDKTNAEETFCSAAEAKAAGYRASKR